MKTTGILTLSMVGLGLALSAAPAQEPGGTKKNPVQTQPNMVWIMTEDWTTDLGCYGTKGIQTPNLDKLAKEGVLYKNAFCTSPVCSPSRSAMMTGFFQNYIGCEQHRTAEKDRQPLPYGIQPIPHLLEEAGYYTCLVGSQKTDCNFKVSKPLFMGKDWKDRKPGQPFFAQITLDASHRRFKHDSKNPVDPSAVEIPPYYPDTPLIRRDWANGYESMQIADRTVGDLLKRLDDEGLRDNTVVFFIGDNGRCHARDKQFLYDPGLRIPMVIRWPGKVTPATVSEDLVTVLDIGATILDAAGVTPPHPLQGVNLFTGQTAKRTAVFGARDKMDNTHDAMRSIRTKHYHLIHNLMPERAYCQFNKYKEDEYPALAVLNVMAMKGQLNDAQKPFMAATKPEFELFDITKDPHEIHNLADDPALAGVKADLLSQLNAWRNEIKDKGVSEEFRKGGVPATYPTKSLAEWEAKLQKWEDKLLKNNKPAK